MSDRQVKYGQPKFFNSFTIVFFALLICGGYAAWRFVPAYLDAWSVDHILKEAAGDAYRIDRLEGSNKLTAQRKLVEEVQVKIRKKVGIFDPELSVDLESDDKVVSITAEYNVVVSHPILFPPTHVHFKRTQSTTLKRVDW